VLKWFCMILSMEEYGKERSEVRREVGVVTWRFVKVWVRD